MEVEPTVKGLTNEQKADFRSRYASTLDCCGRCRYWVPHESEPDARHHGLSLSMASSLQEYAAAELWVGYCQKRSPVVEVDGHQWPQTEWTDFCGDFIREAN